MQHLTLLALAFATASTASASLAKRQDDGLDSYIEEICMPTNSTGGADYNAPCNAVQLLEAQCIYGDAGIAFITSESSGDSVAEPAMQSNATQRTCICESQFFDQLQGCEDCYTAHGDGSDVDVLSPSVISSLSSQYCAVTNTPTLGLAAELYNYATAVLTATAAAGNATTTSAFSDPIGNKTAVSYYFTPSVTGSAAYIVPAQATDSTSVSGSTSGTASSAASSNINTSGGEIVPTAGVSGFDSTATSSASVSSSSTSGGARSSRGQVVAVVGVVAMAGLVAML